MKPKITIDKLNLFQIFLEHVTDPGHSLFQLSSDFYWEGICGEIAVIFCDGNAKLGADTRVVAGGSFDVFEISVQS